MNYTEYTILQDIYELVSPQHWDNPAHQRAWNLLRRGFEQEKLTEAETAKLRAIFDRCEPCDFDDLEMADYGNHQDLYKFICVELGLDCKPGRGPVYRRAQLLLGVEKCLNNS